MSEPLKRIRVRAAAVAAVAIFAGRAAQAETLAQAVDLTYANNPQLQSERAALKVLDEAYVQARAGYGPNANIAVHGAYAKGTVGETGFGGLTQAPFDSSTHSEDLSIVQPLYSGGRTHAAVTAAEQDILAGRQQLRELEQTLIQQVVNAYVDVRRDQALFDLGAWNVGMLNRQLDDTQAKFDLREVTVTDLSQARSRVLEAKSDLALAAGRLGVSRALYRAVVGQSPGNLAPEPELPGVPPTIDEAFDAAGQGNPAVLAAVYTERASRARVAEAKAANHPNLSLQVDLGDQPLALYDAQHYQRNLTAVAVFQQPLFTAGLNASQIRAAMDRDNRDSLTLDASKRTAVSDVSQAWQQILATHGAVDSDRVQVVTQKAAFQGVREEARIGLRSVLEVLNAEAELQNAQRELIQNSADEYSARVALLKAIGRLNALSFSPGSTAYDPERALRAVRNRGAVPWTPLLHAIDRIGAPSAGPPRSGEVLPPETIESTQRVLPPASGPIDPEALAPPPLDLPPLDEPVGRLDRKTPS